MRGNVCTGERYHIEFTFFTSYAMVKLADRPYNLHGYYGLIDIV